MRRLPTFTPRWGPFFEHPSACDPKNFGEAQGGRPAGWSIKCASKGTRTIHDDDKGQRGKWIIQWVGEPGKRDRTWVPFPADAELHTNVYRWKSFREEEPTASLKSTAQGKKKEGLTDRAYRTRNQWNARERMRFFVDSPEEAAPPTAFFFCRPIPSHHHIPLHRIPHHPSPTPYFHRSPRVSASPSCFYTPSHHANPIQPANQ